MWLPRILEGQHVIDTESLVMVGAGGPEVLEDLIDVHVSACSRKSRMTYVMLILKEKDTFGI